MIALARALVLGNRAMEACSLATRCVAAHPASGAARVSLWDAVWHTPFRGPARAALGMSRPAVRAEDRYLVDEELGWLAWAEGDATSSLAAFDSVLAYQSDNPEGQQGRAAALALAGRNEEAFRQYEDAVRMRTGIPDLRCAYARDLLRAGRVADARAQLDAARLLDEHNPTAEALRAWADLLDGKLPSARGHARQALAWLYGVVQLQAALLSYLEAFRILGALFLLRLPLMEHPGLLSLSPWDFGVRFR